MRYGMALIVLLFFFVCLFGLLYERGNAEKGCWENWAYFYIFPICCGGGGSRFPDELFSKLFREKNK